LPRQQETDQLALDVVGGAAGAGDDVPLEVCDVGGQLLLAKVSNSTSRVRAHCHVGAHRVRHCAHVTDKGWGRGRVGVAAVWVAGCARPRVGSHSALHWRGLRVLTSAPRHTGLGWQGFPPKLRSGRGVCEARPLAAAVEKRGPRHDWRENAASVQLGRVQP